MDRISVGTYILIAIAVGVFCVVLYQALFVSGSDNVPTAPTAQVVSAATSSPPVRFAIPSLNINAKVQHVGLTKSGAIGVPSNFTDVAWYEYGPAPGNAGNAIVDGHIDNALSLPGVFKHLNTIKHGDEVDVTNASGTMLAFTVTSTESVPYTATASDIFAATTSPNLVLITCGGTWLQPVREYSERFIVYATLQR